MPEVTSDTAYRPNLRLFSMRSVRTSLRLGLVVLGPVLALVTFLVLGPLDQGGGTLELRIVILADFVYILVVVALVLRQVMRMVAARRAQSAGSRLHLRLTRVFALVALVPTILVAVFAVISLNFGLEGWFSDRVSRVVGNSLAAAQAYEEEHRRDLEEDARVLADYLNAAREESFLLPDGELRQILAQGQVQIQRGLREAFVIDGGGEIRARGERSYLFDYEMPTDAQIARAHTGETVIIQDWDNNEFRALVNLSAFADHLLYVSRTVDGNILNLLDDTRDTVHLYQQLEGERGRLLFEFGLLYLGFAVILILAAIWLGLWFAERLSRPVGQLAGAAQRVGAGDLDVRVVEDDGDDEIAMLGRLFNQMTRQLNHQRNALLDNTRQIERRRRLFDSVLGSITAGVIGVDSDGHIAFVNRSAERVLHVPGWSAEQTLPDLVPEFAPLFDRLRKAPGDVVQQELRLVRLGQQESLLVRMGSRRNVDGELEGYVIAFDDVTDLVTAQRMAAWGDVARRIAHEIKNPLTPIQLSAERIKRKFSDKLGNESEILEQYTDVIIRQTNDLRRIVDEFSKFARMPQPETRVIDLRPLVQDAAVLQEAALEDITVKIDLPDAPIMVQADETMISQALTNLIKNAGEAIEAYMNKKNLDVYPGEIRVTLSSDNGKAQLTIADNGVGLPADRAKLFEPYVTTRETGTGLGLPIVRKIIEEHDGTLSLQDAEVFDGCNQAGAAAVIELPVVSGSNPTSEDRDE